MKPPLENNEQISLLPPPGRKRKHNSLSTLDYLGGEMNNRHSDSKPASSSHNERGENEAASKKSKNSCKMRRASAQVLPRGCPSRIEMSPHSSALGSSSASVAPEFSVAGPSGHQEQTHKTDQKKPLVCDVCGKAFSFQKDLERHKRTHTGKKPFVCRICDKGFAMKGNLMTHLLTHTGERRFSCQVCGKIFTQKHHLEDHLRIHTGEKPYVCEICGRGSSRKEGLQIHLRTHTGEQPYECEWCGRKFSDRSSFRNHKKTCKAKNVVNS